MMLLMLALLAVPTDAASGGDDRSRYLLSGSFFDQDGIVRNSQFRRFSVRLNLDRSMTDRLQVGTNLSLSNTRSDFIGSDNTLGSSTVMGALWFNPVLPVTNPDGSYIMNSNVTWPVQNPVGSIDGVTSQRAITSVVGNVFAELSITDALRLRSSVAATTSFERNRFFAPRTSPQGQGSNGTGSANSGETIDLVNENILTYIAGFGPGMLDLTGGFTAQASRWDFVQMSNSQFANDGTGPWRLNAGTLPDGQTNFSDWTLFSYLARANYNLHDRYLFTVTGRYDGSSRFGANTKWGFFPSAAFAWRVLDEAFMQNQTLFSDLRFRLSYGVTGNQEIGLYQSLARLVPDNRGYSFGGNPAVGYSPDGAAPNPDLKWETTRQYNMGLDLGWLDNRITAAIDAYHSDTDDLLLSVPLPTTSGYSSQLQNIGSVRNRGVEVSLSTVNIERGDFSWRSTLSWAANRNKVTSLGNVTEMLVTQGDKGISGQTGGAVLVLREGLPLGSFYGLRTEGLYQSGDACPLDAPREYIDCVPGEYRYVDTNGDGRIDAADRVVLGDGHPDFYGGLMNNIAYGRFDLSVFLQGSYGNEILNGPAINLRQMNVNSNQTRDALNRWTEQNTNTDIPRANQQRPREVYDVHVEDGSFLRLQTVSLGYRLPPGLVPGTSQARVYVTGENLHVWTRYTGFDPEVNSFGGDSRFRGIDLAAYPRARTWNFGMNVSF
jgi:TonB-dependent starch-binding outer membrane protein SusC